MNTQTHAETATHAEAANIAFQALTIALIGVSSVLLLLHTAAQIV